MAIIICANNSFESGWLDAFFEKDPIEPSDNYYKSGYSLVIRLRALGTLEDELLAVFKNKTRNEDVYSIVNVQSNCMCPDKHKLDPDQHLMCCPSYNAEV